MDVTPKDVKVLSVLRQDSRLSLKEMSRRTNLPISTIYERLREYRNGVVRRNTAIIDFKELGFHTRANVLLKVGNSDRKQLRECLSKSRSTNSVFRVNNGFDFMAEFVFKDMQELEDYLEVLESKFQIKDKQIFYVVEDLKRENFTLF